MYLRFVVPGTAIGISSVVIIGGGVRILVILMVAFATRPLVLAALHFLIELEIVRWEVVCIRAARCAR